MITECVAYGHSLPEAYHKALNHLYNNGNEFDCAAWNTKQVECGMTMMVENAVAEPMISKLFPGDPFALEQYRQEMLDGILDFEIESGKWDYTYHDRMVRFGICKQDQIQFVIDELHKDPSSRRAVIDVRSELDIRKDEVACLQHIQLTIRDGKLNMFALFRSNDAVKAAFMNAFALIALQKRIADELGVEVGSYIHRANSFHCYERDYKTLEAYANAIENSASNLTYRYAGEWDELMEAEKPIIAEKVRTLRNRA